MRVTGPESLGVPVDRSNLVLKALDLLRASAGIEDGFDAELVKRIPNRAGLGGGSSDAAAALVAADRVVGLGWSIDRLAGLAAQLGSDIPYFVHRLKQANASTALATGRGEQIQTYTPPAGLPVVIVKPAEGLSTAEVYGACHPTDSVGSGAGNGCQTTLSALLSGSWQHLSRGMRNHLQVAAGRIAPWLGGLQNAFEACGCAVHQLSGSGSAYFGLARSFREARRIAARLRALRLGQVYVTAFG